MQKFYMVLILALLSMGTQAQDFKFGKVSKEEALEKTHPVDKDANAAVLFRSVNTFYEFNESTGFTIVTDVHERIKIYNKDGFDWANQEIKYFRNSNSRERVHSLKASTYNLINGKLEEEKLKKNGIFEEDVSKYQTSTKFTMPAVTEGSVIEYQYSLRSPFMYTIDDIQLQYTIPINRLEATVRIPEFLNFKRHSNPRSAVDFRIIESRKNFSYNITSIERSSNTGLMARKNNTVNRSTVEFFENVYSINQDAIPALKTESYVDYLSNYAAYIKWELQFTKFPNSKVESFSQTWEAVAKSIFNDGGYERELSRTSYFEKDLAQLLEGETDPLIKAQKIYYFVKSKVKWNSYLGFEAESGGNKVYKDGEGNVGDINIMLTAMLKHAGLNASPVLVSTQNNGVPLFPTQKGFNYVVAGLQLSTGFFLLDATDENSAFGELPQRARNWNGRILRSADNSDWVDLMPKEQSKTRSTLNFEILSEGLKGKSLKFLSGLDAKSYRDNFRNVNKDSYLQHLEKDKGNIKITDLETENQSVLGADIKESFVFELNDAMEVINDKMYIKPMLFMAQEENPFKSDQRTYPIIFNYPSVHNHTVNIMVPDGYEVESLPQSSIVELNTDSGTFKYVVLQNGKFIRIESVLDFKQIVYTPNDYSALKDFYAQIVEKHSEAIVFKKI